jgi:hypothetical protein
VVIAPMSTAGQSRLETSRCESRIILNSPAPVLTLREGSRLEAARILIPLMGDDLARGALERAGEWALRFRKQSDDAGASPTELHILHAPVDPDELYRGLDRLRKTVKELEVGRQFASIQVHHSLRWGASRLTRVLSWAKRLNPSLIVLGRSHTETSIGLPDHAWFNVLVGASAPCLLLPRGHSQQPSSLGASHAAHGLDVAV